MYRSRWYPQTLAGALALLAGTGLLLAGGRPGAPPAQASSPPAEGNSSVDPNTRPLQFQVLANSDDPRDQALKLRVRDAVLPILQEAGQVAPDGTTLARILADKLPAIEAAARKALEAAGSPQPARAELTTVRFPARQYGPISFPPGEYPTLRLILGRGEGHNWWCVLFPPLCFPEGAVDLVWAGADHRTDEDPDPGIVAVALRRARSPLLLEEREVRELPVQARWALVDWLRAHGWLDR